MARGQKVKILCILSCSIFVDNADFYFTRFFVTRFFIVNSIGAMSLFVIVSSHALYRLGYFTSPCCGLDL